ncbi:unnamed protein product, partial [Amoebophrya sp. A25]
NNLHGNYLGKLKSKKYKNKYTYKNALQKKIGSFVLADNYFRMQPTHLSMSTCR